MFSSLCWDYEEIREKFSLFFTARRCNDLYGSYIKIDRGDKIHLAGVGVMAEVEGKYVDDGEYWVADYAIKNPLFLLRSEG
ncbi:hypothetical protein OROMI_006847 [Orobanche minor]